MPHPLPASLWALPDMHAGDKPLQLVSARDLGLAAAACLQQRERFAGQAIPLAADALTPLQLCAVFSAAQGGAPVKHSRPPAWLFWLLNRCVWACVRRRSVGGSRSQPLLLRAPALGPARPDLNPPPPPPPPHTRTCRDLWRIVRFLSTSGYQADVAACRADFPGARDACSEGTWGCPSPFTPALHEPHCCPPPAMRMPHQSVVAAPPPTRHADV